MNSLLKFYFISCLGFRYMDTPPREITKVLRCLSPFLLLLKERICSLRTPEGKNLPYILLKEKICSDYS